MQTFATPLSSSANGVSAAVAPFLYNAIEIGPEGVAIIEPLFRARNECKGYSVTEGRLSILLRYYRDRRPLKNGERPSVNDVAVVVIRFEEDGRRLLEFRLPSLLPKLVPLVAGTKSLMGRSIYDFPLLLNELGIRFVMRFYQRAVG